MAFRKVHGRRLGRPLNQERQEALDKLYPALSIDSEVLDNSSNLLPSSLFEKAPEEIYFEIGFGNGDFLKKLIKENPDNGYIGAEPFINGMSAFLKSIKDIDNPSVRVWMDDAMDIARSIASETLDGIFILNPDPWPKTRHHKRRIVSQENLDQFARILKPGARLTMTTDVEELAEWMVTQATAHKEFKWSANRKLDWHTPPSGWLETRYEKKGKAAGRQQFYLLFEKKS
ncbi:MAG: tRNA (guanosine(46)-N7)-methyltransferase TrmB [Alphaproteobacteria bacterium]|nr:tRNA (guanosine(46)-N7)-methyltransferase TrmB [Alphaproteobacteria bacterium]|tara:strand:+ start:138 stop:827 length:690 start_codon:yes stop_codon:yes gene_type:complete